VMMMPEEDAILQSPSLLQPLLSAAGGKVNNKKLKKPAGESTGRWTKDEHNTFLDGLRIHGKEWKKIANMIATRSVVQIRTHAQKYFQKLAKSHEIQGKEIPDDLVSTATNPKHHSRIKSASISNRIIKETEVDESLPTPVVKPQMTDSSKRKSPKRSNLKRKEENTFSSRLTITIGGTALTEEAKTRSSRDAEDFKWLVSGMGKLPDSSPTSVNDLGFYRSFGNGEDIVGEDIFPLDSTESKDTPIKKSEEIDIMSDELSQLCDTESIKDWINDDDTDLDLLSCEDAISGGLESQPDEIGPLSTFVFGDEFTSPSAKRLKIE